MKWRAEHFTGTTVHFLFTRTLKSRPQVSTGTRKRGKRAYSDSLNQSTKGGIRESIESWEIMTTYLVSVKCTNIARC